MSLQRVLRLLPIGLVLLFSLNMGMLVLQARESRNTFDEVRMAQTQRETLGKIRTACEAITLKAVAWTLTRRSSQGRQYQEGKAECLGAVASATAAMPQAKDALAALGQKLQQLASLLEAIQAEHTEEARMITVGRLEPQVQPLNLAVHRDLDTLTRAADAEGNRLLDHALAQQGRTLWLGGIVGILAIVIGTLVVQLVTRRILNSVK